MVISGSKRGTKNFASLYKSVCKAQKKGLKCGQLSTHSSCILQEPYIIAGLDPTRFRYLQASSDKLLESTSFLKIFIDEFLLTNKKSSRNHHLLQQLPVILLYVGLYVSKYFVIDTETHCLSLKRKHCYILLTFCLYKIFIFYGKKVSITNMSLKIIEN